MITGDKMTDWVDSVFMGFGAFRQGKMSINEALVPFEDGSNEWYFKRDFKPLRLLLKPIELLHGIFSPEDDDNSIRVPSISLGLLSLSPYVFRVPCRSR